ncbi:MAG: DUF3493 domain-containing protein [Prochlorococcus sp.]|nr:DUF3493 domain-containing protein [Prochlorococcaceae cyanobacterium ETNP18_MAG_14]MDP6851239.1 DUF3493 domain-containing protein [Prochlorococcaceae cyanobacterium ETNP1_MAG_8]
MDVSPCTGSKLDPALRERLLQESRTPWRGFRRIIWFALFASASIGLLTMGLRASSGGIVPFSDIFIQSGAFLLTAGLLWIDRQRGD